MPEINKQITQLDPTTARIVSELIQPLAKALISAIQIDEIIKYFRELQISNQTTQNNQVILNQSLTNSIEEFSDLKIAIKNNFVKNNIKTQVTNFEKSFEKSFDKFSSDVKNDNHLLAQSTENILEEISALRIVLENMSNNSSKNNIPDFTDVISKISNNISNNINVNLTNKLSQFQLNKNQSQNTHEIPSEISIVIESIPKIIDELLTIRRLLDNLPSNIETNIKKIQESFKNDFSSNSHLEQNIDLNFLKTLPDDINEIKNSVNKNIQKNFDDLNSKFEKNTKRFTNEKSHENSNENFSEYIHGIEGVLKAHGLSQTRELEAFSNEIASISEQNSLTLTNKIHEIISQIIASESQKLKQQFFNHFENSNTNIQELSQLKKFLKFTLIFSGSTLLIALISFVLILFK